MSDAAINAVVHARNLLSSAINNSIQQALKRHQAYTELLGEQNIRDGAVTGFIDLDGDGESIAELIFPITFIEKPIFTAGFELGDNVTLDEGHFPTWSATVAAWTLEPAENEPLYAGAVLGIVTAGAPRSVLHYRFEARSFSNPVSSSDSVTMLL